MARYKLSRDEFDRLANEFVGIEDTEVRCDYSGRGMWGDECLAYVGPEPMLFAFDLARIVAEQRHSEPDIIDVRDTLADLADPRTDSLGRSTVYYWPAVEVEVDMALLQGES